MCLLINSRVQCLMCLLINSCVQELMNNSELISRIATALIKGDMYDRVSYHSFLTFQYFSDSIWHYLQHVCGDFEARH